METLRSTGKHGFIKGIDLNYPVSEASSSNCVPLEQLTGHDASVEEEARKRKSKKRLYEICARKRLKKEAKFVEEIQSTTGSLVKRRGTVLKYRAENSQRHPNMNCRVETYGRMCSNLDEKRIGWVKEMGFGGMLNLVDMHLPRTLCYWLMTRVDPENQTLETPDGHKFRLTTIQVMWVLGIPIGGRQVPKRVTTEAQKKALSNIEKMYSTVHETIDKESGKLVKRKGIQITNEMLARIEGEWNDEDEEEFKTLFLLLSLEMVLCPTQCPRLSNDLIPALTCAMEADRYDWCELVLEKLIRSVWAFSSRFYTEGYAGGSGGCSIFLAIFYLDHLARYPLRWGQHPRIGVWSAEEIRKASIEDRTFETGDFGKLGMLDVAYGEVHPMVPRDKLVPNNEEDVSKLHVEGGVKCKARRRMTKCNL